MSVSSESYFSGSDPYQAIRFLETPSLVQVVSSEELRGPIGNITIGFHTVPRGFNSTPGYTQLCMSVRMFMYACVY